MPKSAGVSSSCVLGYRDWAAGGGLWRVRSFYAPVRLTACLQQGEDTLTSPQQREARDLLAEAGRVLVLTGAGMSAPSGVPTFRGPDGMWNNFRPEELATPEAFARDARLVWEWYGWRRELISQCRPNGGHAALARWMTRHDGVTLATQNVDGLHERAAEAAGSSDPIRLHGSIFRVRCSECHGESEHREQVNASNESTLPRCSACGGLLRPAVVWFGEQLPVEALNQASSAARESVVCLVIGTSGAVYPAAGLAHEAVSSGASLIVVDPGETAYDRMADVRIVGSADGVVPEILDGLGARS